MGTRGLALSLLSGFTKRPDVDKALLECELEMIAKSGGSTDAFLEHCKRAKELEVRYAAEYARLEQKQKKAAEDAALITHVNREADELRAQNKEQRAAELADRNAALAAALTKKIPHTPKKGVRPYSTKNQKSRAYYEERDQVRQMLQQRLQAQKRQDIRNFEKQLIEMKDRHAKELMTAKEKANELTIKLRQTEKDIQAELQKNHAILAEHAKESAAAAEVEATKDLAHYERIADASAQHAKRIAAIEEAAAREQWGTRMISYALKAATLGLVCGAASIVARNTVPPSVASA